MLQGVCFTVLHRTKQGLGMDCVRGHGFVVARRPQKAVTPRKTFMHWASADTFRPGLSVLDAGLPRKDSAEEREERQEWTAPCYFDISIMGCGDSFGALRAMPFRQAHVRCYPRSNYRRDELDNRELALLCPLRPAKCVPKTKPTWKANGGCPESACVCCRRRRLCGGYHPVARPGDCGRLQARRGRPGSGSAARLSLQLHRACGRLQGVCHCR